MELLVQLDVLAKLTSPRFAYDLSSSYLVQESSEAGDQSRFRAKAAQRVSELLAEPNALALFGTHRELLQDPARFALLHQTAHTYRQEWTEEIREHPERISTVLAVTERIRYTDSLTQNEINDAHERRSRMRAYLGKFVDLDVALESLSNIRGDALCEEWFEILKPGDALLGKQLDV